MNTLWFPYIQLTFFLFILLLIAKAIAEILTIRSIRMIYIERSCCFSIFPVASLVVSLTVGWETLVSVTGLVGIVVYVAFSTPVAVSSTR